MASRELFSKVLGLCIELIDSLANRYPNSSCHHYCDIFIVIFQQ